MPMLMIGLIKEIKALVSEAQRKSYINGFKSAADEFNVKITKEAIPVSISFDQNDEAALAAIQDGEVQSKSYSELSTRLSARLNVIIGESIAEGRSINSTVAKMQEAVYLETGSLRRIARTEIINIGNEGRLAAYKKQEAQRPKTKKPFRFTLIVAPGLRTCPAHLELATRIPAKGLPMNELFDLQQRVGSSHGMVLSGNSLLHPNQRTVLVRVP